MSEVITPTDDPTADADAILAEADASTTPIEELETEYDDDSSIAVEGLAETWDEYVGTFTSVVSASDALTTASVRSARLEWDLKTHCLNAAGYPDFSGQTDAWKALYEARFKNAYIAEGLTEAQWRTFRRNSTQAAFDLGLKAEYTAKYAVASVEGLAEKTQTVKVSKKINPEGKIIRTFADVVEKAKTGQDIPAEIRREVAKIAASQLTPGGKVANGYKPEQLPKMFGKPTRETPKTKRERDNAMSKTVAAHWEAVRSDLEKLREGTLSLSDCANNVHETATALMDILIGGPEGDPKAMDAEKVQDRDGTSEILAEVGALFTVGAKAFAAGDNVTEAMREQYENARYVSEG